MAIKLMKIIPSKRKNKKYVAYFKIDDKREVATHFGSKGMRDYVQINDPKSKFFIKDIKEREKVKQAYIRRHAKREDWNKFMTAGALSRWILWSVPNIAGAIRNYRAKFKI